MMTDVERVGRVLWCAVWVAAAFAGAARADEAFESPLAALSGEDARYGYCHYAYAKKVSFTASGPDRLQALGMMVTLKAWDHLLRQRLPDKDTRQLHIAEGAQHYEAAASRYAATNGVDKEAAERTLVELDADACMAELAKLKKRVQAEAAD